MNIVCLHGFLGSPKDWKSFDLERHFMATVSYPNLFGDPTGIIPFWEWSEQFNKKVPEHSLLVGYSLGGRLAMHAALQRPNLYRGVVIISSHYGLSDEEEKRERLARDQSWAKRFSQDPWESVLHDWNTQPVFGNAPSSFTRKEGEYSRESLARALDVWSLGRQDALKTQVEKLSTPILFITGENDFRYASLATALKFSNIHSNIWIATQSGHRVPWQQSNKFIEQLSSFIQMIQGEPYASRNDTMESYQTI